MLFSKHHVYEITIYEWMSHMYIFYGHVLIWKYVTYNSFIYYIHTNFSKIYSNIYVYNIKAINFDNNNYS